MSSLFTHEELPIYSIVGEIIKLPVVLKPQAKSNQILGIIHGRLKIAIVAPPVDGKANIALVAFMSEILSVKKRDIVIASGLTNHLKMLHLPLQALAKLNTIIGNLYVKEAPLPVHDSTNIPNKITQHVIEDVEKGKTHKISMNDFEK